MKMHCLLSWTIFWLGTRESKGGPAEPAQASCLSRKMKSSRLSDELSPEREQLRPTFLSYLRARLSKGHSPERVGLA